MEEAAALRGGTMKRHAVSLYLVYLGCFCVLEPAAVFLLLCVFGQEPSIFSVLSTIWKR